MDPDDERKLDKKFDDDMKNLNPESEKFLSMSIIMARLTQDFRNYYYSISKENPELANRILAIQVASMLMTVTKSIDEAIGRAKEMNGLVIEMISRMDKKLNE